MSEPSLPELESRRAGLFARLAAIGDFRRGSITENYRRCGKPNCACARPGHRGHGPQYNLTRRVGGKTVNTLRLWGAASSDASLWLRRRLPFWIRWPRATTGCGGS